MDLNDNAFFEDILFAEYGDSDNENCKELKENVNVKEKKYKITVAQTDKLISTMGGRTKNIAKGKLKCNEETKKLLAEWDKLTVELNSLGPPCHSCSKWRRIWSKMKCIRKQKDQPSSVLRSRAENLKINEQHSSTSSKVHPTSSVKDESIESTVDPVKSDHYQQINKIEQQLSHIVQAIASFREQQTLVNEAMNKKLDILEIQQADIIVQLNLLEKIVTANHS